MKVSDLFSAEIEPDLNKWVRKFTTLSDLFSAMPQLYAKLESQNIQGIVEDGAVIVGPVHIGHGLNRAWTRDNSRTRDRGKQYGCGQSCRNPSGRFYWIEVCDRSQLLNH